MPGGGKGSGTGGGKTKKETITAQYAERYVLPFANINNFAETNDAAIRPTFFWTLRFVDRVNLLLSMDANYGGVRSLDGSSLSRYFVT